MSQRAAWIVLAALVVGVSCAPEVVTTTTGARTEGASSVVVKPAGSSPEWFGFIGTSCGVDDPHDETSITDYVVETANSPTSHTCASTQSTFVPGSSALLMPESALSST